MTVVGQPRRERTEQEDGDEEEKSEIEAYISMGDCRFDLHDGGCAAAVGECLSQER